MSSKNDDKDDVANWQPPIENYFIRLVHEEAKKGLQTSTLDKKTWSEIDNAMFSQFGKRYTVPKLKSKYNRLRIAHREFAQLVAHKGVDWDPQKNKVDATSSFWDSYLKKHPSAKPFRKKGLENYEVLGEIFNSEAHMEASSSEHTINQSRRRSLDPSTDLPIRREPKVYKVSKIDDALEEWAKSLNTKIERLKHKEASSSVHELASIEDCMELLNFMEGVDDDAYVKAIEKFTDSNWRRIFVKMPEQRRRMWLERLH